MQIHHLVKGSQIRQMLNGPIKNEDMVYADYSVFYAMNNWLPSNFVFDNSFGPVSGRHLI